jgi:DNA invertase Pin-like site-specific DNA recombinase
MGSGSDGEPLRVDGYIRISRVGRRRGERFISPAVQRDEIEAWVSAHGAQLVEVFEELDQSGRRPDRPLLQEAARRIEAGISSGLVVATVDRFGRSELDGLLMIKRVQDAGGHFFSAREDLDLSTDVGRYFCRELLSTAEFYSDRVSIGWQQAKQKMIERRAYPASRVPFGYRRTRSGRLRPDPATAGYVGELFRRRAAGESLWALSRFMETADVTSPRGNRGWNRSGLTHLFQNRAYLGEIHWGTTVRLDAHPPLIDGPTWQRAQQPPQRERPQARRTALLTGLVRCASCCMSMCCQDVRTPRGRVYPTYHCHGRSAAGPCPARAYVHAGPLETYVVDQAFALLRQRRARRPAAVTRAEADLAAAEAALRRYRDSEAVLSRSGAAVFTQGLVARNQRVSAARLALALAREADGLDGLPTAAELQRQWAGMSRDEQRAVLARVIDCVFISPGRLPVANRATICRTGTAPVDLPRIGDKHCRARRYRPRQDAAASRRAGTRPAHRWTNARLERELRAFLAGKPHWPVSEVFVDAGRGDLLQQARLRGSDQWWAFHLRLPLQDPPGRAGPWTDERIRQELTAYLAGKPAWPTSDEFRRVGRGALRRAVQRTGGLKRWAPEFPNVACPQLHRWTDDEIRTHLTALCEHQTVFPTQAELYAAGLGALDHALNRTHTRAWWAAEMSLTLPTPQRRSTPGQARAQGRRSAPPST